MLGPQLVEGRVQDSPYTPPHAQPPHHQCHLPGGTCVTTDEPAPTRHCHPESTGDVRVTLGAVHPVGLDKCAGTCVRHDSISHSRLTAPNPPGSPVHPSPPMTTPICPCPPSRLLWDVTGLDSHSRWPLHTGSFPQSHVCQVPPRLFTAPELICC